MAPLTRSVVSQVSQAVTSTFACTPSPAGRCGAMTLQDVHAPTWTAGTAGATHGGTHRALSALSQQPLFGVSQKYPSPRNAQSALVVQSGTSQVGGTAPHRMSPSADSMQMHLLSGSQ